MVKTIKYMLRKILPDRLVQSVRVQKAIHYHEMLLSEHSVAVDAALFQNTTLLSSRYELLRRLPKGGQVAEIGVAEGDFSRQILSICQPDTLHLIDPWAWHFDDRYSPKAHKLVTQKFAREIAEGRVVVHRGTSSNILPDLPAGSLDWVYIDGGHDYESVKTDLDLCARVVRADGLITGDDYVRWAAPTERYGVVEAVNAFAVATGSEFIFLTNQLDKHDNYAIRLRKP